MEQAPSGPLDCNDWQPGGVRYKCNIYCVDDGQIYSASNPNPTGWTDLGVDIDFGVNDLQDGVVQK